MVKSLLEYVSQAEADLIEAIQQVRHGELYGVEIGESGLRAEVPISQPMKDLLLYIRSGCQYIDVLTVHNGQPTLAETDLKIKGFRCRKKVKFPTITTEG